MHSETTSRFIKMFQGDEILKRRRGSDSQTSSGSELFLDEENESPPSSPPISHNSQNLLSAPRARYRSSMEETFTANTQLLINAILEPRKPYEAFVEFIRQALIDAGENSRQLEQRLMEVIIEFRYKN